MHEFLYGQKDISWQLGSSIFKYDRSLRSLITPAKYGVAECYNKTPNCSLDFFSVSQDDVSHLGSGIFSKFFYGMASKLGDIRKAYEIMLKANMFYWTEDTDFSSAACTIKYVARNYKIDPFDINKLFEDVGIVPGC